MRRLRFTTERTAWKIANDLAEQLPEAEIERTWWVWRLRQLFAAYVGLAGVDYVLGRPHKATMRTIETWVREEALLDDPTIKALIRAGVDHEDPDVVRMAGYACLQLGLLSDDTDRAQWLTFCRARLALFGEVVL